MRPTCRLSPSRFRCTASAPGGRPAGLAGRAGTCSKRSASARDRGPKSPPSSSPPRAAGAVTRRCADPGPLIAAQQRAQVRMRARTRSVVSGISCLSGRTPARVSTITTASAAVGSAAEEPGPTSRGPAAARTAARAPPPRAPPARAPQAGGTPGARSGHRAPCTGQSYGGAASGTLTRRKPGRKASEGIVLPSGSGEQSRPWRPCSHQARLPTLYLGAVTFPGAGPAA